jgi:Mre11 DNA-binding presumed domain
MAVRHVALVQIRGKEFQLTPLPLRTVRPFVIEEVVLNEVADEVGLDLNDQMAITKFLKSKVSLFSVFKVWVEILTFARSTLSSNKPIDSGTNVMKKQ